MCGVCSLSCGGHIYYVAASESLGLCGLIDASECKPTYGASVSIRLTLWRPLLPYGYSYIASCSRPGEAVIFNFWHPDTLTLKCPDVKKLHRQLNPVWHNLLYSCTRNGNSGRQRVIVCFWFCAVLALWGLFIRTFLACTTRSA